MRIALIAPPWAPVPPELYGGIELVVDKLARGFAEAGHDVVLFTTGESTCPVPRLWDLPLAEGTRIGNSMVELRHVMAAYTAVGDCDIVHDHTVFGPAYAAGHGSARVVTTIHGELNADLIPIYDHFARHHTVIAISHAQRKPAPQIPVARVIHHGIDAWNFPVGSGDGGYCAFIGRMSADKGAQRAVMAAHK